MGVRSVGEAGRIARGVYRGASGARPCGRPGLRSWATMSPRFMLGLAASVAGLALGTTFLLAISSAWGAGASVQQGKPQRVMLLQSHRAGASHGTFVLHVLTAGPLAMDSGRYEYVSLERANVIRDGQWRAVYVAVETLAGKAGTLVTRWRTELVGAGNGTTVGTGTWSVERGTGRYAGASGGGRMAVVTTLPNGVTSSQLEGFLRADPSTQPSASMR